MNEVQKYINELIANSGSDQYDSVSYRKYFLVLSDISNKIMEEKEEQTKKILGLPEEALLSKYEVIRMFL